MRDRFLADGNHSDSIDFFGAIAQGRLRLAGGADRAGVRQRQPRLRAAAAPRADRARPDRRQSQPAHGPEVVAVRGGHAGHGGESGSAGTSPSTTSSSGTRSRTSMSSPSPSPPSPSRASRTSTARATPASRWAATCSSSRTSRRASGSGALGDALRARVAYTWSRFVFVDDPELRQQRPARRARATSSSRSCATTTPRASGSRRAWRSCRRATSSTAPERCARRAYTLFNVRVGFDYKPWNLGVFLEGRNLTDAVLSSRRSGGRCQPQHFFPGDGRAFYGARRSGGGSDARRSHPRAARGRRCWSCRAPAGAPRRTASRSGPAVELHASGQGPRGAPLRRRAGGGAGRRAARHVGRRGGARPITLYVARHG